MADFPSLPLFTDAILADTDHLNDEEFGLYMRILILMWRTPGCRIPNDENWLKKRLKHASHTPLLNNSNGIMETLKEFCKCDGNFWTQKRLLKEYNYLKSIKERNKNNAQSRWGNKNATKTPKNADEMTVSDKPLKNQETDPYQIDAPHSTPPKEKNSPLPSQKPEKKKTGAFKNGFEGGEEKILSIQHEVTDDDIAALRKAAPGWDIHVLFREFNERVNGGIFEYPRFPAKALIAWAGRFTKGKPP